MSDLSSFLRTEAKVRKSNDDGICDLLEEAADEIERLRAQLETLKAIDLARAKLYASARKALESTEMQAVVQQAIMRHPHYDGGPMAAYGFAGSALKAVAAALSLTEA